MSIHIDLVKHMIVMLSTPLSLTQPSPLKTASTRHVLTPSIFLSAAVAFWTELHVFFSDPAKKFSIFLKLAFTFVPSVKSEPTKLVTACSLHIARSVCHVNVHPLVAVSTGTPSFVVGHIDFIVRLESAIFADYDGVCQNGLHI